MFEGFRPRNLSPTAGVFVCAGSGPCPPHVATAYAPRGSRDRPAALNSDDEPVLLVNPVIGATAAARGGSPAQVLIAWHLQSGISTIPER